MTRDNKCDDGFTTVIVTKYDVNGLDYSREDVRVFESALPPGEALEKYGHWLDCWLAERSDDWDERYEGFTILHASCGRKIEDEEILENAIEAAIARKRAEWAEKVAARRRRVDAEHEARERTEYERLSAKFGQSNQPADSHGTVERRNGKTAKRY